MSIFSAQTVKGVRRPIVASSAYAEELTKWEAHYTEFGPPGRPYDDLVREGKINPNYPTMMYQAKRPAAGGPPTFDKQEAATETDRTRLESIGYVWGGPAAALAALEQLEEVMATAAAERAYADRKMSDRARIEADAKDSQTIKHLGEIPSDPLPAKNPVISRTK